MSKKAKVILAIVFVILLILTSAVLVYFCGASYPAFERIAKASFDIPGLDTTFVPQGLTYDEASDKFLVSGYMSDGSASRIYLVDKETGECEKYVTISYSVENYTKHAGGIAVYGDMVWVAGDREVVTLSMSEILAGENEGKVIIKSYFETGNGCDFLHIIDDQLIVGEFYKEGKYETEAHEPITVADNAVNNALSYVYDIDLTNANGIDKGNIVAAISMPDQVQGMTVSADGEIILSTSYSIPSSKIYVHDNILLEASEDKVELAGKEVTLYILDNDTLINTISAPSMSEELVTVEGKTYILFESACSKYRLINRTRTKQVYAIENFDI